jgi:hypothetical protein
LCILGNLFFALNYNIPDIYVYLIPTYFVLAIYFGIGIEQMFARMSPAWHWLFLLLPLLLLAVNFPAVNQHNNTGGMQAKEILNLAGNNAVIFGRGRALPKMYFFYYLYGEDYYRNHNLYVVKFAPRFVDAYLFHKRAYRLREMRRQLPPGLTIYCTTEGQKSSLQEMGFRLTRVGEGVYRAEGKAIRHPSRLPAQEQDEED